MKVKTDLAARMKNTSPNSGKSAAVAVGTRLKRPPPQGEPDISEQKAAPKISKSSSNNKPDKSEKATPQELD